jgi:aminodeoxyfutalosine synthase
MVLETLIRRSGLGDIYDKAVAGRRVSDDDGLRLYRSRDINVIGAIANVVRERKNGNHASYILNRYLNYSNICILDCQFCEFGRKKRDAAAFELGVEEMVERVRQDLALGITEVHIVGGLHPSLPFGFYVEMIRALKALSPALHVKAFTAVEIYHLAWLAKKTMPETLAALRDAGLDSITGGGAEIFSQRVRDLICKGKETAEQWLDCHRTWHKMGRRSTCTMLYGHVETLEERVDHLRRLRELQDETGGFTAWISWSFQPDNTELGGERATGWDYLKNTAVSRLMLDNVPNLQASWVTQGPKIAQVALRYGLNDFGSTMMEENVVSPTGTNFLMQIEEIRRLIAEAGYQPRVRDTLYRLLD